MIEERLFSDRAALFAALAEDCAGQLRAALQQRGHASLLVSGGSTPAPLYARLAATELAWSQISVALVDERWVEVSDARSNTRLLQENLLCRHAAAARFVPMLPSLSGLPVFDEEAAFSANAQYARMPRPFDLILLGMGNDGHTASLFPGASGLASALDPDNRALCAPLRAASAQAASGVAERISLTLTGLLSSRRLLLLIVGEDKWRVYQQARQGGSVEAMPIRAMLQQTRVPLSVYWAP